MWADGGSLGQNLCAARCSERLAAALVQRFKASRYHFLAFSSIPSPDTMRACKSCWMARASALEEYISANRDLQYLQSGIMNALSIRYASSAHPSSVLQQGRRPIARTPLARKRTRASLFQRVVGRATLVTEPARLLLSRSFQVYRAERRYPQSRSLACWPREGTLFQPIDRRQSMAQSVLVLFVAHRSAYTD